MGRWKLEERYEFFATVLMPELPQESAAKKSSDETPAAPQPVGPFGEPSSAPPGVRFGIPAFAHSRYLAFAFQASLEDPRRCCSTELPLTRRLGGSRTSRTQPLSTKRLRPPDRASTTTG
ncbi:MAG: hypothetical protein ISQ07_05350 [Pirellulales bacterium]|nr:hypothetical protein [Pirellulales bacterium]